MLERLKNNLIDFFLMVAVVTAIYSGLKYVYQAGYNACKQDVLEIIENEKE